jgi:5-methylcytosine-specific restriction endonuclease McrA
MAIEIISRAKAQARGLKRYFTGRGCKRGHVAERFISDCSCSECNIGQSKKWKAANREKCRSAKCRQYASNPVKFREQRRKSRSNNPEKTRVLRRIHENRRRARKVKTGGSYSLEQLQDLFKKQNCKCAGCLCSIKRGYHNDHIIALSRGGSNYISNIQLLCQSCNQRKGAKDPVIWAQQNGRLL